MLAGGHEDGFLEKASWRQGHFQAYAVLFGQRLFLKLNFEVDPVVTKFSSFSVFFLPLVYGTSVVDTRITFAC